MSRTTYAISWLYGEFRVARFSRGKIDAQWESPTLVNTQAALIGALDAACQHMDLGIKGDVIVVHEHDLHTHEYLEVPGMKRRDLEKYLARRVENNKSFDEDAAWCYHMVHHKDGKEGILLHQLPRNIVDSTVAACTAAGLVPKSYVPLTEIVSDYLPTTDVDAQNRVLVLACFEERIEMILALGDGEALFVRELNYGANEENVERLVTDVNRTLRYTRQHSGRTVDVAWIMGHPPWTVVDELRKQVEVPVEFDADAADPNFWALWATKLSGKRAANFISVFEQKNITGEVLRRVGVFSTAAVIITALFLTLVTSGLVAHRNEQMRELEQRSASVQQSIADLEEILANNREQQEHLDRLRATSHNLPSLMLQHLSQMTPPEVTLTEVAIEQSNVGWQVRMAGLVAGDLRHGARVLAGFESALAEPPWRMSVTQSFKQTWMEQFEQGKLADASGLGFAIAGDLK